MLANSMCLYCSLVVAAVVSQLCHGQHIIQTFTGRVGVGNSTYYRLTREGDLSLVLESLEGDADIYVSQTTLSPSYEDYELQSVTCGLDVVDVSKEMQRPIGVTIYGGYGAHTLTVYQLSVVVAQHDFKDNIAARGPHQSEPGEESILWTIFVNILKILFDILV